MMGNNITRSFVKHIVLTCAVISDDILDSWIYVVEKDSNVISPSVPTHAANIVSRKAFTSVF